MPIYYGNSQLSIIQVEDTESIARFRIEDNSGENSISIEYKPILVKDYNTNDFEIHLFENNYLNAENDVFQIIDKNDDLRLGWIFPLSNLEGTEHDQYENIHLNRYKYVAFQLLLEAQYENIKLSQEKTEFDLSDLYPDNPIILILSSANTVKIKDFSVINYLPSLSKFGYFKKNEFQNSVVLPQKDLFCTSFRGVEKLYLYKSPRDLTQDRFLDAMFQKLLKSLEHHLVRFHLLYQVIEYILSERFDAVFDRLLLEFQTNKPPKNDFIEELKDLSKERINIKKVIECISKGHCDFDANNLKRDATDLLNSHKKKIKTSVGDLLYDIRNLIVHNYRDIEDTEIEIFENITHELELLIMNILEKFDSSNCD